jgi:PAS domain S-box-containing protein
MWPISTITLRLFFLLFLLISSVFGAIYVFSVPLIKENVFKLELNSSRQVLNIASDLASRITHNADKAKAFLHSQSTPIAASSEVGNEAVMHADEVKKRQAIAEISEVLKNIKITNNGYLYMFNSDGNMLFHPNANIDGHNFKSQLNSVTGNPIYIDLMNMADKGQELYYQWDRPDDPGHYQYEKVSLTRHLPDSDWYISSSVYLDDLRLSSVQLGQRIVAIGIIGLLAGTLIAFLFAKWITAPICKLSSTAEKINKGDLMAKTGIRRNDELGVLATSFDHMVDRMRNSINTLNLRVEARTSDLSESNRQLLNTVKRLETTQAELRAVETRQRLILNALPAQIAYLDSDVRFVFANRECFEFFNETKDGIVGKRMKDVVGATMYRFIEPNIQRALKGERVVYEYAFNDNNRDILTRRTVLPFYDETKTVIGFLTLSIDITKEREAEKRLAQASKMKTVGQMSGGLAHDFNNLLTIILGNLLELQNQDDLPEEWHNNLEPAIRATRRGADMTRRLLAFSRRQPLSPSVVAPASLMSELVELLSAPLADNIVLLTSVEGDCPPIYVDPALMEDALVNLILNSADAMKKGGTLSVVVKQVSYPNGNNPGAFDEPVIPGQYVSFTVIDCGEGFSSEALARACEPFFTTKGSQAGSGLGLSMVFGFVKQSKGYMSIQNNAEAGASVEILIPVDQQQHPKMPNPLPTTKAILKDKRDALVLLVEDNKDVRYVVRKQLLTLGYSVLEASSADEALGLLAARLPALVGVVSDGVMPGKASCYDILARLKQDYQDVFFVLMTGYSDQLIQTEYDGVLLQKPFDTSALSDAIASNLVNVSGSHNE